MAKVHRNSLQPGYRVHWYEIIEILGQGGFGITYLALDTNLKQKVAIKEYLPIELAVREGDQSMHPISEDLAQDYAWGLGKFIAEAQTLAKFDHPNIVRVHTVFEANNTAYMVMGFEEGQPFSALIESRDLDEARLVDIALSLIDGLSQVHAAGFIHRDIKPANIYIRADGMPVLLDFGSARQALGSFTQTLTSMVSPGYAPFEQYMSDAAQQGPWTDIYALGATLYRAACGTAPMSAIDRSKPILHGAGDYLIKARELGAERYSAGFLGAIDHALAFKESERPQDLATWRAELTGKAAVANASIAVETPTAVLTSSEAPTLRIDDITQSAAKPRGRWKWLLIAAISALLIGAGATILSLRILITPNGKQDPHVPIMTRAEQSEINVEARVRSLLRNAEVDITALRLTTPQTNNAYAKYQAVLSLEPTNAEAQAGIRKLAFRYLELARDAARDEDWPKLLSYLDRARMVNPNNNEIARAENRLRNLIEKHTGRGRDR